MKTQSFSICNQSFGIKSFRKKHIRPCQQIVDLIFINNPNLLKQIHDRKISSTILELRDLVYSEFLIDEANFNIVLMEELQATIDYRSVCAACIEQAYGIGHDEIAERVFYEPKLARLTDMLFV